MPTDASKPRLPYETLLWGGSFTLFAALAAYCLVQGYFDALVGSQDFQWSPTVLLLEGKNPYAWYLEGNADGRIILSQQPNYLQLLYVVLFPFGLMSWAYAKGAWALVNTLCGVACAHLAARRNAPNVRVYCVVVLAFFMATAFRNTVGNGQFGMVALLAFLIAWPVRTEPLGGLALALGSVKYSFAPPFWVWLLLERGRAGLVAGLGLLAAGWAIFSFLSRTNPLQALFQPIQVGAMATGEGIGDVMSFCRHFHCDETLFHGFSYLCAGVVLTTAMTILWRRRKRLDDETIFAALCVVALASFFHLAYDLVFLLPAFAVSFRAKASLRAGIWIIVGYLWFVMRFIDHMPMTKTGLSIAIHFGLLAGLFGLLASVEKEEMAEAGRWRFFPPHSPSLRGA